MATDMFIFSNKNVYKMKLYNCNIKYLKRENV